MENGGYWSHEPRKDLRGRSDNTDAIPGGLEPAGRRPGGPMRSSNRLGEWRVGRTEESPYGSVVTR